MEILIIILKLIGVFIYLVGPIIIFNLINNKLKNYNKKLNNQRPNGQFMRKIKINKMYGEGFEYIYL